MQKSTEIERFLRHLQLLPDGGDVVSVRGPPKVFDFEELERRADWDEFYDELAVIQARNEDWAA